MKPDFNNPGVAHRSGAAKGERGIVLVLALILLVIISMVAIMAVKGSISGEQVSNNLRSNAVATQAAETALRYCENEVLSGVSTLAIQDVPLGATDSVFPTVWATRANWSTTKANTVTAAIANSANAAGRTLNALPQCMIEKFPMPGGGTGGTDREAYVITARGFSPDYALDSGGKVISGGEVWLQSVLRS